MSVIEVTRRLSVKLVRALIEKEVLAVRVPGFLPDSDGLLEKIEASPALRFKGEGYLGFGPGVFDLLKPEMVLEYQQTRSMVESVLSPVSALLGGDLGPLGFRTEQDVRLRPLAARQYDCLFSAPVHQDARVEGINGMVGLSLPLTESGVGGALKVWDYERPDYSGPLSVDQLGEGQSLEAEEGELLLIDASRAHQIDRLVSGKTRTTVSGFLGFDMQHPSSVVAWS